MQSFLLHQSSISITNLLFTFGKSDMLHPAGGSRCKLLTLCKVHSFLECDIELFEIHCHHNLGQDTVLGVAEITYQTESQGKKQVVTY